MERVDGLLLGAQQQHQYFNSSDHVTATHKGMDMEYHAIAGVNVQDRVQFEADKQAVYRYLGILGDILSCVVQCCFFPILGILCFLFSHCYWKNVRRLPEEKLIPELSSVALKMMSELLFSMKEMGTKLWWLMMLKLMDWYYNNIDLLWLVQSHSFLSRCWKLCKFCGYTC